MCVIQDTISLQFGSPRQAAAAIESLIAPLRADPEVYGIGVHFNQGNPSEAVITAKCEDASVGRRVNAFLKRGLPTALASAKVEGELRQANIYVAATKLGARASRRRG